MSEKKAAKEAKEEKIETVRIGYASGYVDVELKKCGHCGTLPTMKDAQKAVERDLERIKGCAVCGGKPKLYPKAALHHSVEDLDRGPGGWILCGLGAYDPELLDKSFCNVSSYGPPAAVNAAFHIECLKRVAPGAQIDLR